MRTAGKPCREGGPSGSRAAPDIEQYGDGMNEIAQLRQAPAQPGEAEAVPHNIEAEQQLLGAILTNNDIYDRVAGVINESHFYDPVHARIYEIAAARIAKNALASPVTLKAFLEDDPGLTVFLAYLRGMYGPVQGLTQNLSEVASARAGLDRVFTVLDEEPDIQDRPGARPLPPLRGEIRLEGVSFAFEPGTPVLQDVDPRISAGEMVALVGRTGAGKSTLASLVLRFFDPQRGRVSLDGCDLREFTLESLRRQVTLMLQEPIVFHASVADNVAFGAPDTSFEKIEEAARRAEADAFIRALPQGYDTLLGRWFEARAKGRTIPASL